MLFSSFVDYCLIMQKLFDKTEKSIWGQQCKVFFRQQGMNTSKKWKTKPVIRFKSRYFRIDGKVRDVKWLNFNSLDSRQIVVVSDYLIHSIWYFWTSHWNFYCKRHGTYAYSNGDGSLYMALWTENLLFELRPWRGFKPWQVEKYCINYLLC